MTTEPVRTRRAVDAVDLDLDVVRLRDGSVLVLDEDEFEEHQRLYRYPADLVAQARSTCDDLVGRITSGDEPFAAVGAAWLTRFVSADCGPAAGEG